MHDRRKETRMPVAEVSRRRGASASRNLIRAGEIAAVCLVLRSDLRVPKGEVDRLVEGRRVEME